MGHGADTRDCWPGQLADDGSRLDFLEVELSCAALGYSEERETIDANGIDEEDGRVRCRRHQGRTGDVDVASRFGRDTVQGGGTIRDCFGSAWAHRCSAISQPPTRCFLIVLLLFMFAWLVLMGFDAKRFAWSSVPALMQVLGALITLWSIWFCYRTMRENSFAAPVIKLQHERGERALTPTGPLPAFVRHPMHSAPLSTSLAPRCCLAHGGVSYSLSS